MLLVTNIFPPDIGGPATFIDNLGWELTHRGYSVTVVCTSDVGSHKDDQNRPFRLLRLRRNHPAVIHDAWMRAILFREAARSSFVFTNGLEHWTSWACRKLRKPYVLKVVGDRVWQMARIGGETMLDIDAYQETSRQRHALLPLSSRREDYILNAARIIVPSKYVRQMVIGWGAGTEKVVTVLNGVAEDDFGPIPVARCSNEPLRILYVGRLTNWKGCDVLLQAVQELDGVQIQIVGDGPEYPALAELSQRLGLADRVCFKGKLPRSDVRCIMSESHVLVLMSLYEGLSHTLLEAGAMGLACVASDKGGNPEVLRNQKDGLLLDPRDVEGLRHSLIRLRDDEDTRLKFASSLQQRVRENFQLQKTVDGVIAALENVQTIA